MNSEQWTLSLFWANLCHFQLVLCVCALPLSIYTHSFVYSVSSLSCLVLGRCRRGRLSFLAAVSLWQSVNMCRCVKRHKVMVVSWHWRFFRISTQVRHVAALPYQFLFLEIESSIERIIEWIPFPPWEYCLLIQAEPIVDVSSNHNRCLFSFLHPLFASSLFYSSPYFMMNPLCGIGPNPSLKELGQGHEFWLTPHFYSLPCQCSHVCPANTWAALLHQTFIIPADWIC